MNKALIGKIMNFNIADYNSATSIKGFIKEDIETSVELLDEMLEELYSETPITYDEFKSKKRRILKYCFSDIYD